MAENSGWWTTGGATGDQQASYSQADFSDAMRIQAACSGFEGVAVGYLNGLACSDGGANTVDVATGGGMVDGKWFLNNAIQNVNIPSASGGGNTRIDRIVLRASWANYNVSVTVISGTDAASPTAPAITQTSEMTYDIKLCQVLVDTSGNVTVTDEREWAAPEVDDSTIEVDQTTGRLQVKDGGIDADAIATGAVGSAEIAADAVDGSKIANDSINSEHYVNSSIDTIHIGNSQVTPVKTSIFPDNTDAKFYYGYTIDLGTTVYTPHSGWSISKQGTGHFRVTHPLGNASYLPFITSAPVNIPPEPSVSYVYQRTTTYFDVKMTDLDGVSADGDFYFLVLIIAD